MESEVIKRFNSELSSIHESKAPSKSKIQDITRAALKAKSLYKHVVFSIEKFLSKCKPEHRLHVLYIIDSIIRASKHQFKEKDVFAQRFLSNFDKIFNALLNCKKNEQLKIVRTINLWQANGVYTKEEMEPTLNLCRQAGLETDVEAVEKAVKGSAADMRIYGGSYIKKNKKHHVQKSTTPPMPPPPLSADGLLGAQPMEPPFVPSEEIVDGVISEKEMLDLIESSGCDTTGMFSKDSDLLRKAHSIFVSSLKPRVLEHNTNSLRSNPDNIKNVLTKDFDYSDDEDEKDEEKRVPKEPEPEQLTHEEIFGMAAEMMKNQNVVNALTTMIHERVASINAAANAALQHNNSSHGVGINQENSNQQNFGALHGVNINQQMLQNAQIQAALQQQGRLPPGIAQNAALAQLQALQNVSQPQSNLLGLMGNPMLNLVPGGLGLQGLAQNNGPVTSTASGIEISSQLNMTPMGVPPPNMHDANDLHAAAQQQIRLLENEASRNETDSAAPSRRRSRSRERVGRNGTKERDRSRDRERRKMGLPPIKPGVTFIASRTLWFKKVPANCSESDLKAAVLSTGDVARVKVIGNRACAYVTMETRKAASDVVNKLREVTVARKTVKVYWARAEFMNDSEFSEMWDMDRGVLAVPYEKLPESLEKLCDGAMLDIESLPETKKGKYKVDGTVVDETPNETAVAPPYPYGMPPIPAPVPPPPGMGQHYAPPPMSMPPPKPPQGMLNLSLPPPGPPGAYRQQMMPPHMMQQPGVPAPGVPPPAFNMNQCGPPPAGNFNGPPPIHNQMMYQNSPRNGPPPPMRGGFRGGFRGRGGYDGGRGGYGGRGGFDGGHGGFRNDGRGRFEDRRFDDGWNRRGGRFEDRRGRWNNRRVSDSRETGIHDGATEPKRIHADDETVSSTTLDDVKPSVDVDNLKKDIEDSDLNGEVPMDLE